VKARCNSRRANQNGGSEIEKRGKRLQEIVENLKTNIVLQIAGTHMYCLNYYVPVEHHEKVKQALFDCGAGRVGKYDQCSWQVKGEGQFRPLQGSSPVTGEVGQLSELQEYKVEMVCDDLIIKKVLQTLLAVHPYEQPAYNIIRIQTYNELVNLDDLMV
jgi:hypothetical protein